MLPLYIIHSTHAVQYILHNKNVLYWWIYSLFINHAHSYIQSVVPWAQQIIIIIKKFRPWNIKKEKLWYNDTKKKFDQIRQGPFHIFNRSNKKEQPFLLS
jgi:hypothetical protein